MIRGAKPNGYTLSFSREGKRIEAETRQCVHCQFMWTRGEPHTEEMVALLGRETRRGYCLRCNGFICCRAVCIQMQLRLTGNSTDCIPFEDQQNRIMDKLGKLFPLDQNVTVTPNGLIVPAV